jgi:hypothetical protein
MTGLITDFFNNKQTQLVCDELLKDTYCKSMLDEMAREYISCEEPTSRDDIAHVAHLYAHERLHLKDAYVQTHLYNPIAAQLLDESMRQINWHQIADFFIEIKINEMREVR